MSIDIITYENENGLPWYLERCIKDKVQKGFKVLPITPDSYDCKPCHAGYKHFKEITLPKLRDTYEKGIFICEGDIIINDEYNVDNIPQEDYPVWYGYKKILKQNIGERYIVGNFLIWLPKSYYPIIHEEILKKGKRLIYSDRFFTQLVDKGIIKLHHKSIANEISHWSNVINNMRDGIVVNE